jgi:hypothetical protein
VKRIGRWLAMWAVVAFVALFGLRALVDDVASPPESPSPSPSTSSDGGARRALSLEEIDPGDRGRLLADVDLRSCERVAPTYVATSTASPTRFCEREVGRLLLIDSEHTVDEVLDAFGETARPIKELGEVSIGTEQGYRVVDLEAVYGVLGHAREWEAQQRLHAALVDPEGGE